MNILQKKPSDIAIKDMELPQIYVTEKIPELLYVEDLNLPQVHLINNMCSADQLEKCHDPGLFWSPINHWIEASCANSACQKFDSFFYPHNLVFHFSWLHEQTVRHFLMILSLFLSLSKHRKWQLGIDKMLEWLHWLYAYT